MRGTFVINLTDYNIFSNNIISFKEASMDDSDKNNIQYMTESAMDVVSFDAVKTQYTNALGLSEENAKSVDALMTTPDCLVLVEFKNGKMKTEKSNVINKVRDSLLILCDIIEKSISYTRKNMKFILVYNESKNCSSRNRIAKHFSHKANEPFISFGMETFKEIYFKEVYTYTELEFEQYLVSAEPSEL